MYLEKVYGRRCREERQLWDIAAGSYRNRCLEKAVMEAELEIEQQKAIEVGARRRSLVMAVAKKGSCGI